MSARVRARCIGSIVGAVVADAAAMGVQWIYDPVQLRQLHEARLKAGHPGLDFHQPPASPHFDYETGRNSPYGEQSLVLLQSLAENGCLDTRAYADAFGAKFGTGWTGYRDASCKGFLRRWATGATPPATGAEDYQINCVVRLPAVVAAFGGVPCGGGQDGGGGGGGGGALSPLQAAVPHATRVTQNTAKAVAWAMLGAEVLQQVIYQGETPQSAVGDSARRALTCECGEPGGLLEGGCCDCEAVAAHLYEAGGHMLYRMLGKVDTAHGAVVSELGKNCHIPNSMQTPVHCVLHHLEGAALPDDVLAAADPAARQALFAGCIRDAIRQGGCCGSRAGVAGALLGAHLGGLCGDLSFIPPAWIEQTARFEDACRWAERICQRRDCT